ncbi:MAG: YicC/YloC family endoribonuclease [Bacillota bacterium]|nr:YicC/YloC family endoribonuclease [Bacillota bacterium]
MISSMTGYGQGNAQNSDFKLNIEMKSVNNRYLDINIRLPRKFNIFEEMIKDTIKSKMSRGKVDVFINVAKSEREDVTITPDFPLLERYVEAYQQIIDRFELKDSVDLGKLLRNQDILIVEDKELDEEESIITIKEALNTAVDGLIGMRQREGEKLKLDIIEKTDRINIVLEEIRKIAPEISVKYKEKMQIRIRELLDQIEDYDEERLNMEVAVFADKKDINEEIVRLDSHFSQLNDLLSIDQPVGRKLDFLLQEINREVNTIGSKSPDFDISNYVVDIKSELEKIREQIQNIE